MSLFGAGITAAIVVGNKSKRKLEKKFSTFLLNPQISNATQQKWLGLGLWMPAAVPHVVSSHLKLVWLLINPLFAECKNAASNNFLFRILFLFASILNTQTHIVGASKSISTRPLSLSHIPTQPISTNFDPKNDETSKSFVRSARSWLSAIGYK